MCGRITALTPRYQLNDLFDIRSDDKEEGGPPRYNVVPSQPLSAVRIGEDGTREWALLTWGLVPFWAEDPSIGRRLVNARLETAAKKPAFRAAFRHRRCLIPVDGYYEWKKLNGAKQPFYIRPEQGHPPFALAGLWERWRDDETDQEQETCVILTRAAAGPVAVVHDRMPVVVRPAAFPAWLMADDATAAQEALQPPSEAVALYPVSRFVNNPRNDGPRCIEPLAEG